MAENPNRKVEKLLPEERLGGNNLFARITVFPGREIDYHEHHGETETYHIISGEGVYSDNGGSAEITAYNYLFLRYPAASRYSGWSFRYGSLSPQMV